MRAALALLALLALLAALGLPSAAAEDVCAAQGTLAACAGVHAEAREAGAVLDAGNVPGPGATLGLTVMLDPLVGLRVDYEVRQCAPWPAALEPPAGAPACPVHPA